MTDLLASLVHGPSWRRQGAPTGGTWWRLLACVPLLAGCAAMLLAAVPGAVHAPPDGRALLAAAAATLASFALALPVAIAGISGEIWLVALVAGLGTDGAGWSLLRLPPGTGTDVARACVLSLPVMVYALVVASRRVSPAQMRAAAAAGAGPWARGGLLLRGAAPGALAGIGVVFVLALGVV